jgi:hypothetical protein
VAQKKAGATAAAEQSLGHLYPVQLDPEEDGGYVVPSLMSDMGQRKATPSRIRNSGIFEKRDRRPCGFPFLSELGKISTIPIAIND